MCDDQHAAGAPKDSESSLSRRGFLHASAGVAAAAAVLRQFPRLPLRSPARPASADGLSAYSMAMHVHSSFSEQDGSMDSQLFQATKNSVDVLWWTDHDTRMDGIGYRQQVHFTSLTREKGGPGQGRAWDWTKVTSGPLGSQSTGGIVQNPCSPNDPVAGGSLHLIAKSTTGAAATFGFYAQTHQASWNYRDNLNGQSLTIDVLLTSGWTAGYLELLIVSSYHEAIGGRPAGGYQLSYQFVPPGGTARRTANGLTGTVTIPVTPDSGSDPWGTVTINPAEDIAALWPDMDYRDFGLYELTLAAVSTGDLVEGYFDYLRFDRTISGEAFFKQQADMSTALAARYHSVVQQQGLEVSLSLPHVNWFGKSVSIPDYGSTKGHREYATFLAQNLIPTVHASGGLISYNHPFGYADIPELPQATQDSMLVELAKAMLPTASVPAALGTDLLEVGYDLRQGVDLAHHVALWDIMSRNALFLTGNGTNDDHFGKNWFVSRNNWFTSVWADSTGVADLLAPLAAGRAWCASLSGYRGSLDLLVDGSVPMGSVSVSRVSSRRLVASATAIPAGGTLQILQGAVDYAGAAALSDNTTVIGSYPAAQLTSGSVAQPIDTGTDSFVRTQVLDSAGTLVGLSNPVWLLRTAPPGGIPAPRQT
jgi:hypothetical protein